MDKKLLIIIDSSSVIHRAFHALPPLTTKKGELINALYGFLLVFLKVIKELQPEYIAACFDLPQPTFRHEQFKEYKAKRPPAPQGLYEQVPKIKEVLKAFDIPIFEKEGFEADDVIAAITEKTGGEIENVILSGDLDTLQLVSPVTKVYFLRRGVKDTILYDEKSVGERYEGLTPSQLVDFKALRGDPSDNVPGVKGIGEKTALKLIKEAGSLENLYQEIESPASQLQLPEKLKIKLVEGKENAFLAKSLVSLAKDVPIDFSLEKCRWQKFDKEKVREIFEKFEFRSLIDRLP
jgi:DNA polymerase-1